MSKHAGLRHFPGGEIGACPAASPAIPSVRNFASVSTNSSSSAFGRVTTVRDPRQVQLGVQA
jgi:hypothetical protein